MWRRANIWVNGTKQIINFIKQKLMKASWIIVMSMDRCLPYCYTHWMLSSLRWYTSCRMHAFLLAMVSLLGLRRVQTVRCSIEGQNKIRIFTNVLKPIWFFQRSCTRFQQIFQQTACPFPVFQKNVWALKSVGVFSQVNLRRNNTSHVNW